MAEFFDAGQSRTVAWGRRPQAAALAAALADPGRGWDAIVIGEYERAEMSTSYAAHIYARTGILTHAFSTRSAITVQPYPSIMVGNQIAESVLHGRGQ